jgi:hypothetical protein
MVEHEDIGNGKMLIKCDKFGCYVTKPDFSNTQGDHHTMYNQDVDRDTSSNRQLGNTTNPTIADSDEGTTDAGWTGVGHQQPKEKDNVTKPKPGHKDGEITKPIPDGKGGKGSFDECESKNQDKKNPGAFCGQMQNGVEGKEKEGSSSGMQQGRYGGVRGLGGYNTSQQGSEPIAQITEVKNQIEETEKALADVVEDKKTPSSNGDGQGSHSVKGYSTIELLNRVNTEAQYVNIMADLGALNKIIGGIGAAISGGVRAIGGEALGGIKDIASDTVDAVGSEVSNRVLGPSESESESQN